MSRIEYSPAEQALLALLKAHKMLDATQLADLHYKGRERPWHAAIIINSAMRSLIAKAERNRETFVINRFKPVGRKPSVYRLVKGAAKRT